MGALADSTGLLGVVVKRLDAFNARHPWSHNDHFHGWILRHLPERRAFALDAGCGRGRLVQRLAPRFDHVLGVDADDEMATAASQRCGATVGIEILQTEFDLVSASTPDGGFDLVTMVAVLHHLDLDAALRQADALLAPGGRLLVVGLSRPATHVDTAWDVASGLVNPLMGLVLHPRAVRGPRPAPDVPVRDPLESFDEIRAAAHRRLPGSRLQRRLFVRYTLEWTKPFTTPQPDGS